MTDRPIGDFAIWLRSVRARMSISQTNMAKRLGITAQYYTLLENGHRCPGPTLRLLLTALSDTIAAPAPPSCLAPRYTPTGKRAATA